MPAEPPGSVMQAYRERSCIRKSCIRAAADLPKIFFDIFFITEIAGFIEPGVFYFIRQILLVHIVPGIVMSILISDAMPQLLCTLIMRIP